jgi:hypothetical protein
MCLSAREHHPEIDVVIVVADGKREARVDIPGVTLLWAEDLQFPGYLQCAFKYNIIEFNTALKPHATRHLLERYEQVIYLDPDTCLFGRLESVLDGLSRHTAVFTPHALSPYDGVGRPNDRDLLRFGSLNLGFFAVRRDDSTHKLLDWWHERCRLDCFYEPQLGLGVDQKWMDLALSYFDGLALLKSPGLNVAFWNLHERQLSRSDAGWTVNGTAPLEFVHFSSFVDADEQAVADKQTRYAVGSRPDFSQAGNVYRDYLQRGKALVKVVDPRYSYGQFDNGATVSPALRRFYAVSERAEVLSEANPFSAHGAVYRFARGQGLVASRPPATTHVNFKVQASYSRQQQLITIAFRWVLRLIGPDRYFNLMRYLAHYSSLLNQGDLLRK